MIVFFCDRDLGKALPARLREAGLATEQHAEHFRPDTSDEDWLREVGRRGWYALTHNERIRYTVNERDAVMHAGVGLFVLVGAARTRDLADNFIRSQESVARFIADHPAPFIAKVFRPTPALVMHDPDARGRVEMWLSETEWRRARRRRR